MGERRGTKALELWCRRMCEGYPGVKIDNMTTSWRDGLAFCALIHHFRPDLIDFSKLDKNDIYTNNELAFRVAESHLGIPALLEPEDMVEYPVPDRLSILTYLSQFYQTFVNQSNSPTKIPPKRPPPADLQMQCISSSSSSPPKKAAFRTSGIQREPCSKCDLPVFIAERLNVGKSLYHRTCFRCARCDSQLTLTNYYETENAEFCCETCPDEEKSPKIPNATILSKSLSDEEKSASLKNEFDVYSNDFENLLERPRDESLRRNFTIDRETGGKFAKARSEFMTTQVNSSSSSDTESDESEENQQHGEDISAISSSDLLPTSSDKITSSIKSNDHESQESQDSVTKSIDNEPVTSSIKSRIKLFEASTKNNNSSESDVNNVSEVPSLDVVHVDSNEISQLDDSVISENQADKDNAEVVETTDPPDDPNLSPISEKDSVIVISDDSVVVISDDTKSKSLDYPEDLNPFDDEIVEEDAKNVSLNPFGDTDDEEEPPKKPQPAPRLIKVPPQSTNPFESDDDDDEDLNRSLTPPQPSARKLLKAPRFTLTPIGDDEAKPKPLPRSPKSAANRSSDTSSLSGSGRKKKPAPKPPTASSIFSQDSNDSPLGSVTSSPSQSVCHSPKTLPKFRKMRRAPLPPIASSTPLVFGKSDLNTTTNTVESGISPLQFRVGSEENLKTAKNEMNLNTQLSFPSNDGPSSLPNKSTYGKWKRRKGQAPQRPIPQKRSIKNLPINEIKQELERIEVQQLGLEKQGVTLEKLIRERSETPGNEQQETLAPEVEDMVLQLFEIVNEKNELFRRQTELMYLRRQHRLEEEHAEIEYQIRCLMLQPEANKTDSDKAKEEELINRLMEIVERRNEIVDCVEMNRKREADEDTSITSQLNLFTQKREETPKKDSSKKDKEKRKKKEKKSKSKSKVDADKDIDESETSVAKEKKKKKKFSLF